MSRTHTFPATVEEGLSRLDALYARSGVLHARRGDTLHSYCVGLGHAAGRDSNAAFETRIRDGKIVGVCHGCGLSLPQYVTNLGGNLSDLMPRSDSSVRSDQRQWSPSIAVAIPPAKAKVAPVPLGPVVAVYPYDDADGKRLFEIRRHEPPKELRPYLPGVKYAGIQSIAKLDRPIYRLPAIRQAIDRGEQIWIAEGEKDVNALVEAGVAATCNAFGASHWESHHTDSLAGVRDVILVADADIAGWTRCQTISADLARLTPPPKIVIVQASVGNDASDHLSAGCELEDFDELTPDEITLLISSATTNRDPEPGTDIMRRDPLMGDRSPTLGNLPDVVSSVFSLLPYDASDALRSALTRLAMGTFTLGDLEAFPPREYLVTGVIPSGGVCEIVAPPGTWKTFVALALALCIINGVSWLGLTTRRTKVLYVCPEGKYGLAGRVRAWLAANPGLTADDLYFLTVSPHLSQAGDAAAVTVLARHLDVGLIVLDTMARTLAGWSENDSADMTQYQSVIDSIIEHTDATVLLIHHTTKADKTGYRGSSVIEGMLDTLMIFHHAKGERVTKIWLDKSKDSRDQYYLSPGRLSESGDSLAFGLDTQPPTESPVSEKVLAVLAEAPGPLSGRQVWVLSGLGRGTTDAELPRLYARGLVRKSPGARNAIHWSLAPPNETSGPVASSGF